MTTAQLVQNLIARRNEALKRQGEAEGHLNINYWAGVVDGLNVAIQAALAVA